MLFEKLYNEGCGVYLRLVMLYRRWMLEEQMRWFWEFQQASESLFFCMPTCLNVSFFETNRKQTTCTNKFSMCLPRYQFCLAEAEKRVFFGVRRHATRDACAVAHFSSQGSKRAKLGSNKSQSKGQETSSDFVVSFGSLEQKLELERDGL